MSDTAHSSWITDHAFEPRTESVVGRDLRGVLPPNLYLCEGRNGLCRMAEAAHAETTVKR